MLVRTDELLIEVGLTSAVHLRRFELFKKTRTKKPTLNLLFSPYLSRINEKTA